ncbi:sulfurtransferase complex subunit TusC [Shewanella sp. Isolate11]|uniref:sulfurtransferase complex subunit TusC n=1 Tax=Shewanella sp. Isolate11 TaxID=2908530 RepID=UPI001EFD8151|nr:sulfurtransferase complex subunit TusC [Shewanella sp. Isolate11]
MKKITIIFRHAPHGNASSREGLDLALLSASFEQEISLVFADDGVLNLLKEQQPSLIGGRDFISTFKALPLYDIDNTYACKQSMNERGISESQSLIDVELLELDEIKQQLTQADEVFVY